jgi:hypothetical protein
MHSAAAMLKPKTGKKIKSSEHDPDEEAKACLYTDNAGHIGIPAIAVLSAMRKSATQMKKAGQGKKTLKDFVFSGLRVNPDLIVLPEQKYAVDMQIVVVNRSRVPRARPRFDQWGAKFNVEILDDDTWDAGTVRQVLDEAGKYQGLLDYRPLFGTFEVTSMKDETGKEIK